MPYVNKPRPYRKEYEQYGGTEEQKKKRAKRNAARRLLEREGVVRKGDGKDVDHKHPISKGGGNHKGNLRAVPASENRSFSRNSNHTMKSAVSAREKKRANSR